MYFFTWTIFTLLLENQNLAQICKAVVGFVLFYFFTFYTFFNTDLVTHSSTKGSYWAANKVQDFEYDDWRRIVWKCSIWISNKALRQNCEGHGPNLISLCDFWFLLETEDLTLARGLGFIPGIIVHQQRYATKSYSLNNFRFSKLVCIIWWPHSQGCFSWPNSVRPPPSSIRLNFFFVSFFRIPGNFSVIWMFVSSSFSTCIGTCVLVLVLVLVLSTRYWYLILLNLQTCLLVLFHFYWYLCIGIGFGIGISTGIGTQVSSFRIPLDSSFFSFCIFVCSSGSTCIGTCV